MRWKDNGLGFSPLTLVLHWVGASLVLSLISIELMLKLSPADAHIGLVPHRNLLWVLLFLISGYRFWARLTSFHPLPLGTTNPVEVIISRSMAMALLLAGVLLPIAHVLRVITTGQPFDLAGVGTVYIFLEPYPNAHAVIVSLYTIGISAALAGLALHIFGALKNHFILKNDTLKRMLGKNVEL